MEWMVEMIRYAALLSLLALCSACGPAVPPVSRSDVPAPKKNSDAPQVSLITTDWDGVQKMVAAHRGKVVVVEIWTTTCGACVETFPQLVELQRKYSQEGLACIAVNCDYDGIQNKPPEFYRPDVLKFLEQQHAEFENVLLNVSFIKILEQLDLGSTPTFYVYNRSGKLHRRFDNDSAEPGREFTHQDLEQAVQKLLAEKAE